VQNNNKLWKGVLLMVFLITIFSTSVISVSETDDRIKMWFKLDEPDSPIIDNTTGRNMTECVDAACNVDYQQDPLAPNSTFSVLLDGVGDRFIAPNISLGNPTGNRSFCYVMWLEHTSNATTQTTGNFNTTDNSGWFLEWKSGIAADNPDKVHLNLQGSNSVLISKNNYPVGSPYMLSICYNFSLVSIYFNSTLEANATSLNANFSSTTPLVIGSTNAGGSNFRGYFDDFVLFENLTGNGTVISSAELSDLHLNWIELGDAPAKLTFNDTTQWLGTGDTSAVNTINLIVTNSGGINATNCTARIVFDNGTVTPLNGLVTTNESGLFNITTSTPKDLIFSLTNVPAGTHSNQNLDVQCIGTPSNEKINTITDVDLLFVISSIPAPAPGGGGGGSDIKTKPACDLNLSDIIFFGESLVAQLTIINKENFTITPSFLFSSDVYDVISPDNIIQAGSQSKISIVRDKETDLTQNDTTTMSSPECRSIKTNILSGEQLGVVTILDAFIAVFDRLKSNVSIFGFMFPFYVLTILSVVVIGFIASLSDVGLKTRVITAMVAILVANIIMAVLFSAFGTNDVITDIDGGIEIVGDVMTDDLIEVPNSNGFQIPNWAVGLAVVAIISSILIFRANRRKGQG